ncbi:MAG TPA: aminotransferase class V-fold PLP-dependent enzyme [Candidatus Saccharimonadales bacterium]|nr:aminotransferase class V-fold PLP-dependent enzyme [Candidatus Saccharimonadales bacterium]
MSQSDFGAASKSSGQTLTVPREVMSRRVVNAAGFATTAGGAPLHEEVRHAMQAAAEISLDLRSLADWAGRRIAEATGAEAGWVTSGASAGLALASAACVAGADLAAMARLPAVSDPLCCPEIVVQHTLHNSYNHALRLSGARLIGVGYPTRPGLGRTAAWDFEAAIGARTVAVAYTALEDSGSLPLLEVVRIAHARKVPVIVDAADRLPPVCNLRAYVEAGADLVVYSGGKGLRGPQASGILTGRSDLIASARLQQLDMDMDPEIWRQEEQSELPYHGIGRSMKVGKEEIAGLVAALDRFCLVDHEMEAAEMHRWLEAVAAQLRGAAVEAPSLASFYPRLVVRTRAGEASLCYRELARADPPILASQSRLAREELVVCPESVRVEDRAHLVHALIRVVAPHT